ncbi:hypothetical protein ACFE04_006500 [Oxalis oulophora]
MQIYNCYLLSVVVLCFVGFQQSVQGRVLSLSSIAKPDHKHAAASARWLVSQSSWGVLSTISSDLGGSPFGNVVSFSDGLPGTGTGIPYFYLTSLDPTAKNSFKDQRSSLTVSEYPIGTCGKKDPENPTCSKITLSGKEHVHVFLASYLSLLCDISKLVVVDTKSEEAKFAQNALFTKHPEMKRWPRTHNFQMFKLEIEGIFLINYYGGAKDVTADEYLQFKMNTLAEQ